MNIPELKKPDINISGGNILKKLRPRKRHLRFVWKALIILAGLSMVVGQVAFYALSGSR